MAFVRLDDFKVFFPLLYFLSEKESLPLLSAALEGLIAVPASALAPVALPPTPLAPPRAGGRAGEREQQRTIYEARALARERDGGRGGAKVYEEYTSPLSVSEEEDRLTKRKSDSGDEKRREETRRRELQQVSSSEHVDLFLAPALL